MKKNKAKTQHVLDTNIHKQGKQNKVIQGKALSSLSTGFSNNSLIMTMTTPLVSGLACIFVILF
jgi:hypothetical protein